MHAAYTEELAELTRHVRDALGGLVPPAVVRAAARDRGEVRRVWGAVVELGLLGVLVRSESGGLGLDARDAVSLAEACGYVGLPGPFVDTAWVAAPLLDGAPGAGDVLAEVLAGTTRIVALSPTSPLVADADLADHLVVLDAASARFHRVADVVLVAEPGVDAARRPSRVSPIDTPPWLTVPAGAALDRGVLASAAFQLGLGRRMLDLAVSYARVREQFGRAIGSYQAVQHHLADTAVALAFAAPLVHRAAWSLAIGHPDTSTHVSMAHLRAAAGASAAGRASLQVHGAVGYTTEHDLQLFLKRAWSLRRAWGDDTFHHNRVADAIERRAEPRDYWDG